MGLPDARHRGNGLQAQRRRGGRSAFILTKPDTVCRSVHRDGRSWACIRRGERSVRARTSGPDELQSGVGLVLRLSYHGLDDYRVRTDAPERDGYRRPRRYLVDAGRRRGETDTRRPERSRFGHLFAVQPIDGEGTPRLLRRAAGSLRHRCGTDGHEARRVS